MTTGNAPTLEFLIEQLQECAKPYSGLYAADLMNQAADSLKELQSIRSAELPVEPFRRFRGVLKPVDRGMWVNGPCDYYHDAEVDTRIDTLQSALKLAQSKIDAYERVTHAEDKAIVDDVIRLEKRAESAESRLKRMVELMKRPPDEYLNISDIWSQSCDDVEGCYLGHPTQQHYFADLLHKAMSAELLKEVEK